MRTWTMADKKFIANNLHKSDKELATHFGVSEKAIKTKRKVFGILRPKSEWHFKKGHKTWNKGKAYNAGGRSVETRFKKGQISGNARAIGEVFQHKESSRKCYLFIKLKDRRAYPYGRYVYEQKTGEKLTTSEIIRFKDGNPLNCDFHNLQKITRAENALRNINREKAAKSLRGVWAVVKAYEDYGLKSSLYKFKSKRTA